MNNRRSFFQLLSEKPWEQSQITEDNNHNGKTLNLTKANLGVRSIITVNCIFFSLFIVAYADRMLIHDWQTIPKPLLLWLNTFVLFLSSIFFHKAKVYSDLQEFQKVKISLSVIGFLSALFIVGQLIVWKKLMNLGYFFNSNIANSYFYLFTTLHVMHLLGGLFFWKNITLKIFYKNYTMLNIQSSIKLCAMYWHFLFLVWLVLFGLMLNS